MAVCFVYITAGSMDEARTIGRALVDERLAACANILPSVTSVYRWQGAIEYAEEVVLIAKTREALVPRLSDRVAALHSYDCPCVVAMPIVAGHADYLDWISAETEQP